MRNRPLPRAFQPVLAGVVVIGSLGALAGCHGTITDNENAPPGSGATAGSTGSGASGGVTASGGSGASGGASASGGAGGTISSGGAGSGTGGSSGSLGSGATAGAAPIDPSAVPGELSASYTRLTRNEYRATVRAAFDVDATVSGIPADTRVGPFTSNVGTLDPIMKEFVLASEDLAAQIVPSKLPVCTAATAATCVSLNYQAPIERLFRRALTPAEVTAFADTIGSLETQGITSENATRAMVVSALISPDFLFRSTPVSGDAARGRRLTEHLSYALWDAPPDAALVAAGQVTASELGASLRQQASRLGSDARAVPVLARFVAQWLGVDTDERLADPNAAFATSPLYAELQAFVQNALTTAVPVQSFVNGTQGFVQKENFAAYGMAALASSDDVVAVTWSNDTIRRGILGEELFLDATRHPDVGRRPIFRGYLVRSALLCEAIESPTADVVALDAEVSDRATDARCAGCHSMMDPIGRAFAPLDLGNTAGAPAPEVIGDGEVTGAFADLPAMLNAIAVSQTYADCFSRHLLGFFLEQDPAAVNAAAVGDVSAVVKAGGSLADAVGQAVVSLERRSQAAIPWCTGQ